MTSLIINCNILGAYRDYLSQLDHQLYVCIIFIGPNI